MKTHLPEIFAGNSEPKSIAKGNHPMKTSITRLIASGLLLAAVLAHGASVPGEMNYQGQILNAAGQPLTTGNYTISFAIFEASVSGTPVWGPYTNTAVAVVDGSFNVVLPAQDFQDRTLLSAATNSPRFLEITIGNNLPIAPRQELLSAPYALNTELLQGYGWSSFFDNGNPATGTILGARIAAGSITSSQLSSDSVTTAKISDGAVTTAKIQDGAVNMSKIAVNAVGTTQMTNGAVTTAKLADGAVTPAKFAPNAVTSAAISDGTIQQVDVGTLYRLSASDGDPAAALSVDAVGNIGIGTVTPHHRLSIAGGPVWTANQWQGAVELENGSAIGWRPNGAGQRFGIGQTSGGFHLFRTSNDPGTTGSAAVYDFVVNDSGNVGIGTETPTYKLDVNGTLRASSVTASSSVTGDSITASGSLRATGQIGYFDVGGGFSRSYTASLYTTAPGNAGWPTASPTLDFFQVRQTGIFPNPVFFDTRGCKLVYNGSPSELILEGADMFIQGALSVTNIPISAGTPVYWNSITKQFTRGSSSKRYKQNIQPWHEDAYSVLQLKPKTYTRPGSPDKWEVGYVAEDLDQLGLKSVTVYDGEGRPEAIDYSRIVLYTNEILKDQQKRLQTQQEEIHSLKGELEAIKSLVRKLGERQR